MSILPYPLHFDFFLSIELNKLFKIVFFLLLKLIKSGWKSWKNPNTIYCYTFFIWLKLQKILRMPKTKISRFYLLIDRLYPMMKLHPDGCGLHLDGSALFTGHKNSPNGLVGMKMMECSDFHTRHRNHLRFCTGFLGPNNWC